MGSNHKIVISLQDRLEAKLMAEPNSGCWLWTGAVKELGYGVIGLGTREQGTAKAHRAAWEVYRGPIPAGLNVLHKCDTPACCNPSHLYIGTLRDNARDCVIRGRSKTPNNRGELASWRKLSAADVLEIRAAKGLPRGIGAELARRFKVCTSTIYEIWAGRNWASL